MRVNPSRRCKAHHGGQKSAVLGNQRLWNAAGTDNFLPVINVMQKGIDGTDSLFNTARQFFPLLPTNDAGDNVKRYQPFLGFFSTINIKGYACSPKKGVGFIGFAAQPGQSLSLKPCSIIAVGRMSAAIGTHHFIKGRSRLFHHDLSCQKIRQCTSAFRTCTNFAQSAFNSPKYGHRLCRGTPPPRP